MEGVRNCFCTLGALGDICNTLPLVWDDYQQGNTPTFYIARQFESILDGVGYCDRLVWDGHYSECLKAAEHACNLGRFDYIYVVQCYGAGVGWQQPGQRLTDSFCKEAWRLVGKYDLWDKLPLVFDRRDLSREAELLEKIGSRDKPKVLVSTSGRSSPFPHTDALNALLKPLSDKFDVIYLDGFKADRIYDLIGLMEKSACLITTDSGLLHLSNAVPQLPVIALITHSPDLWHGSPKRKNHIAYIRYCDFPSRSGEIKDLLLGIDHFQPPRRLIHVWSDYSRKDSGAIRRNKVASQTWDHEYRAGLWVQCVVHEKALPRNATIVGERKPVPFVKDLLGEAVKRARPHDVIVFSNDDTCFSPGLTDILYNATPDHGAVWGSRLEHPKITSPLSTPEILKGYRHCGADIFAFTPEWWNKHESDFPDFLLTFEMWDLILKKLINETGGMEIHGTCYHEIHASFWHVPENRECEGNLYNRELGRQWIAKHHIKWEDAFK